MDHLEYLTRAILALNVKSSETLTFYQISISSFKGAVSFYLERSDLSADHEYETVLKAATVAELAGYVSAFLKGKGIDIPPAS